MSHIATLAQVRPANCQLPVSWYFDPEIFAREKKLLFEAGARRVRLVESTQSKSPLQGSLGFARWDLKALEALGKVEFENTRNLGHGAGYAHLKVPNGGYLFTTTSVSA